MNYIIAEIQNDDTLKVTHQNVPEDEIANRVDSDQWAGRNMVAIPYKSILVESKNYGYNTEVTIKE